MKDFIEKIKTLRKQKGLSQQKLANETNISQSNIARWEKNKNEPKFSEIKKLCRYFEVSADYLLGLEDEDGTKITQTKQESRNESMINNYVKIGKNSGNVTINNKNKK